MDGADVRLLASERPRGKMSVRGPVKIKMGLRCMVIWWSAAAVRDTLGAG